MDNLILGITTIIICTVIYFFSWRIQTKGNFKIALLLLMLGGLIIRAYVSADFFLHDWDERYHALVSKNFIRHMLLPTLYDNPVMPYDIQSWTSSHIWLHKQPIPLWTMAVSMWLFGVNEIALRLPSIVLTTIGIYLTFYIASYFFNKKTAFIAAFLY
nr:glycosyltransferase family 39 protein [Bacteroidota bacterium]